MEDPWCVYVKDLEGFGHFGCSVVWGKCGTNIRCDALMLVWPEFAVICVCVGVANSIF